MRSIRLLSAAILAATGLIAVGVTTQTANAASLNDLNVTYSKVMTLEKFQAYGTVSSHTARVVKLQYRNKTTDPWTTKSTKTSSGSGSFSFDVATGKTRYYRFYAPKSGSFPKISGNSRKVTVVAQTATAYVTPNPVYYYFCETHADTTLDAVVSLYPSRLGRNVSFTTPNGVSRNGTSDGSGHVNIPFNINKTSGDYYITVTAQSFNNSAAKSAAPTKILVRHRYFCLDLP